MPPALDPSFYYLSNFLTALAWIDERYDDLLDADERHFITCFRQLDTAAQALLVRLIMRKGPHFRASKLHYAEIGCVQQAAAPLLALGWLSNDQPLPFSELFALLRKDEVVLQFRDQLAVVSRKKSELFEHLADHHGIQQPFSAWCPALVDERLYSLTLGELCDRLRLLFFGNLQQDWSEFVLAELGIFRYEQVPLGSDSRGFRCREDLDGYLHLWRCREQFAAGLAVAEVVELIGDFASANPYVQARHDKLLFRLAQQLERDGALDDALALYRRTPYAGSRQRQVRLLERSGHWQQAWELAATALAAPESAAEAQLVERAAQRLARQLGGAPRKRSATGSPPRIDLCLPRPQQGSVEYAVLAHLHEEQGPVHYVENGLVCSLFGLLCWEAIFAPLPGAFFHPFHAGPVDLLSPDFASRREPLFSACLQRLDSSAYQDTIRSTYRDKFATLSPFVYWDLLSEELLEQALQCLPAAHLKAWFQRLLGDLKANRAGMPDLIQFWPQQRRYRMIEVKGPGDRLQDNQRRWLAFCAEHGMPVDVCYVQWAEA
ncbi:VRR-NUC domain-containing protein [Pseudomonas sp. PDM14]|uniref:VRR-NUC domain-containing protein n=1 Tax=Pseudomonas sp. PDM14 TaxID=2769288 RepID=UPI0017854F16|nr:VRR-NUC domain-containing protein [Pseudomonas sp. PDM14]MBD9481737.1 VRR-NUC domain-containing protein [Pseudomonas sp. PDM14]